MVEVGGRGPIVALVVLAACLLPQGTKLAAQTLSGEIPGDSETTARSAPFPSFSLPNLALESSSRTNFGDDGLSPFRPDPAGADVSEGSDPQPAKPVPAAQTPDDETHITWGPLLGESVFFATIENVKRVCCEIDIKPELKGVLLSDYFKSVANMHGWDDYDPFTVQYLEHSFQGAVAARLEIQNDPLGKYRRIGAPGYWRSAWRGFLYAAAYGAAFKIGPYGEAMIGNVGLPNEYRKRPLPPGADYGKLAWSEFIIDPVGGTLWCITEDLLDRYVIGREEQNGTSHVWIDLSRSFLTPSRTFGNVLRFQKPWYRERPPVYAAGAVKGVAPGDPDPPPLTGLNDPSWELFGGCSYLHASSNEKSYRLTGWESSATRNLNPWFGFEAAFGGLYGSGPGSVPSYVPRYTFLFGPHVSFRKISRATPFVHWLLGGARGPARTTPAECPTGSPCKVSTSSDTFFAGDFGGGFDVRVGPRFSVRAIEADYLYDNFHSGQAHAQISTGITFNLRPKGR